MQVESNYAQIHNQKRDEIAHTKPLGAISSIHPKEPDSIKNVNDNDVLRSLAVAYAGYQSKITQLEIYIQGSTGSEVDLDSSTEGLLKGFQTTKKQQDAMSAYAQA